jgi:hypothetical protein
MAQSDPLFGRFVGTVELRDARVTQDLEIQFDLEIEPDEKERPRFVRCCIMIDNLAVRTTREGDQPGLGQTPYVLEMVSVSIRAAGGKCWSPEDVAPLPEYFIVKQIETQTRDIQAALGYSGGPQGQLQVSAGTSKAVELPPVAVAIRPLYIGTGLTLREHIWEYEVQRAARTWLELSKQRPPEHRATFRLPGENAASLPRNVKVSVTVVSRRANLFSGLSGLLSPGQWQANWLFGHLKFVLETKVTQDSSDYFKFPTAGKVGQERKIVFQFLDSVGQGIPLVSAGIGNGVECRLECSRVKTKGQKPNERSGASPS